MIPMHRKARPCPLPSRKPHLLQAVFRGTSSSGRAGAAAQTGAGAFFGRSLKKHGQAAGCPAPAGLGAKRWGFALPPCAAVTPQPPVPAPPVVRRREWSPCPARPRPSAVRRAVRAQAPRYFAAQAWTISSISAMCRRMSLASAIWQRARTRLCSG